MIPQSEARAVKMILQDLLFRYQRHIEDPPPITDAKGNPIPYPPVWGPQPFNLSEALDSMKDVTSGDEKKVQFNLHLTRRLLETELRKKLGYARPLHSLAIEAGKPSPLIEEVIKEGIESLSNRPRTVDRAAEADEAEAPGPRVLPPVAKPAAYVVATASPPAIKEKRTKVRRSRKGRKTTRNIIVLASAGGLLLITATVWIIIALIPKDTAPPPTAVRYSPLPREEFHRKLLGKTKEEVQGILGPPKVTTSQDRNTELWTYDNVILTKFGDLTGVILTLQYDGARPKPYVRKIQFIMSEKERQAPAQTPSKPAGGGGSSPPGGGLPGSGGGSAGGGVGSPGSGSGPAGGAGPVGGAAGSPQGPFGPRK
jgi:hypothetical protein